MLRLANVTLLFHLCLQMLHLFKQSLLNRLANAAFVFEVDGMIFQFINSTLQRMQLHSEA